MRYRLAASAPFLLSTVASGQLPLLETEWNALDGNQNDVAGPSLATDSLEPHDLRLFLANGRRRAAHFIDTRERQFTAEDKFDSTLIAVELDEENDILISLTDRVIPPDPAAPSISPLLIVQNALNPGVLADLGEVALEDSIGVPARVSNIRAVPSLKAVIVFHPELMVNGVQTDASSIELFDYDPASPTFLQPFGPPTDLPLIETCGGTGEFHSMGTAEVAQIGGQTIAFIQTTLHHDGSRGKPQASGIVACDISDPAAPSFFTTPLQVFDPVERHFACVPVSPTGQSVDRGVIDFVHAQMGTSDLLCVAGGVELQFRGIDVTNFQTSGFVPGSEKLLDVQACQGGPSGFQHLTSIVADPVLPREYITSFNFTFALDVSNPLDIQYECTPSNFGKGFSRDVLFLIEGPDAAPRKEVWTVSTEHSDYKWKITDVTDVLPGAPDVQESRYAAGGIDGIVAILPWDSVYVPTYGGIVRYDVSSGGDPIPMDDSYQAAVDPVTGKDYVTEELELGLVNAAPINKQTLFSPSARGGFTMWPIDDQAPHDPLPPTYVDGVVAGAFPSWPSTQFTFGSDIAFGQDPVSGEDFVLLDYYNVPQKILTINRFYFVAGAYHWDTMLQLSEPGISVPVIDIAIDGGYAFVTARGGFFVVDLSTWAVVDAVLTSNPGAPPICGRSFPDVEGIARHDDRLFVSMSDLGDPATSNRIGIAVYGFGEATGQVSGPLQCLFDGLGGQDDFPGIYVTGGGRVRLIEQLDGTLRVYSTSDSGHLLEMEYDAGMLTPLAYWHDGSFWDELSDCPIYPICLQPGAGFGPVGDPSGGPNCEYRVIVPRWNQGWVSVVPSGFE